MPALTFGSLSLFFFGICAPGASAFVVQAHHPMARVTMASSSPGVDASTTAPGRVYQDAKAVLFDIDGTLSDSWKLGYDATIQVLKNNNVQREITDEEYHAYTRYCTPERLARHTGLLPEDDDFDSIGGKLGHEFDELYVDLVNTDTAGLYPGVQEFLAGIPKSVKVGALTNACVAYAHAVLRENGLTERFGSVHGADSVPKPKPNADGLLKVCSELGVQPSECVYIGDSPSDAGAAEAAGMPSIGVMWGSHSKESLEAAPFAHYCDSVEELVNLLPIDE